MTIERFDYTTVHQDYIYIYKTYIQVFKTFTAQIASSSRRDFRLGKISNDRSIKKNLVSGRRKMNEKEKKGKGVKWCPNNSILRRCLLQMSSN